MNGLLSEAAVDFLFGLASASQSARNVTIQHCTFNQTGGNALVFSGSVTDSHVIKSTFPNTS